MPDVETVRSNNGNSQEQSSQMSGVLSSWKEIAAFLGKGVRTVQRWERADRLPIHRPSRNRKIVLAYRAELAKWIEAGGKNIPKTSPELLVIELQKELALLREELSAARIEIERVRSESTWLRARQELRSATQEVRPVASHRRSPRSA